MEQVKTAAWLLRWPVGLKSDLLKKNHDGVPVVIFSGIQQH